MLIETIEDRSLLEKPVDAAAFAEASAPLWAWTDAIRPSLWRQGRAYPRNYPAMKQLLADGGLEIIFAFNPAEASGGIAAGELPDTVRSFTFPDGTLGNTHFVAIPYNSSAKVVANFVLSPEAQLRKEDPAHWGDPTVLDIDKLPEAARDEFAEIDRGAATLGPQDSARTSPSRSSWMTLIQEERQRRYGS